MGLLSAMVVPAVARVMVSPVGILPALSVIIRAFQPVVDVWSLVTSADGTLMMFFRTMGLPLWVVPVVWMMGSLKAGCVVK